MNDRLNDITPSFTPVKCPVCNSFGTLKYGSVKCHGCNGKGFIVIDNRTGLPVESDRKNENEKENN